MVTVKMNGQKQLISVHIEPDVFKSKDQEMLQELVLAAVNEAIAPRGRRAFQAGEGSHRRISRPDGEDSRIVLRAARAHFDFPIEDPQTISEFASIPLSL